MLKIIIQGTPAAGKTTLASEIAALLESLKMGVTVVDCPLDAPPNPEFHELRARAMAGRDVTIVTENVRPPIKGSLSSSLK